MNRIHFLALIGLATFVFIAQAHPANAQDNAYANVEAGQFDNGKMFTLDDPPLAYFEEEYGFTPDADWFEHAQLGALRFATYCSASFASADGLIFTNHHCARQSVTQISVEDGTDYNEPGFFAQSMADERPVEGLFVEQLIAIEDVTAEVDAATAAVVGDQERRQARRQAITEIQDRMGETAGENHRVQVVTLYSGGQYKAYTYRRYDNIRLVFAPETQMGYYGGDPDNFTFPRYSLDFSLFRAYGDDGHPLQTENFFQWNPEGTQEGDLVFIIGNPGSTTRLQTVAQLEYRRDITEPAILGAIHSRELAYGAFVENNPDHEATPELTDSYFSLANARKAYTGRVEGLLEPYIMARRADAEQDVRSALASRADLQAEYGSIMDAIAANRAAARDLGPMYSTFVGFRAGSSLSSTVIARSILAYQYLNEDDYDARAEIRDQIVGMDDQPLELQQALLTARFADFAEYLGSDSDVTQASLGSRSPSAAARAIMEGSALTTSEDAEGLLDGGDVEADPGVAMVMAIMPQFVQFQEAYGAANAELGELSTNLARGRFEIYGTSIPPDATFTLRISDGVVKGYEYNGTVAPTHTTFYGLYDHYYSYGPEAENGSWNLPDNWLPKPDGLDLSTPYNFVSTNDIIGGNSGSPMLDRDLNVVGIAFDGNEILVAASDELFRYDRDFRIQGSYRNRFLKHCHEVCRMDRTLFLTSTGFDSLLAFDLNSSKFVWGFYLQRELHGWSGRRFDPETTAGPGPANAFHINMVCVDNSGIYLSGLHTKALLRIDSSFEVAEICNMPAGVHNAQPCRDGVIFNDTAADCVRYIARDGRNQAFRIATYDESDIEFAGIDDSRVARQGFGRGLCPAGDRFVAGGSSPSTVTLYDLQSDQTVAGVNLTMDIRNAIHGLELWPYDD